MLLNDKFALTIPPSETRNIYGINSSYGYNIYSKINLRGEIDKIIVILAAYVEVQIAEKNAPLEETFNPNSKWKTKEELSDDREYKRYLNALNRLEKAENNLSSIKAQYQVTRITPFY